MIDRQLKYISHLKQNQKRCPKCHSILGNFYNVKRFNQKSWATNVSIQEMKKVIKLMSKNFEKNIKS